MPLERKKVREEKSELLIFKNQAEKELEELRRQMKAMAQAQMEWKNTVVQLQTERNSRDQVWMEKEKTWDAAKAEWESTITALEKAKADAIAAASSVQASSAGETAVTVGPEATKALTSIRQNMQEMQTLLTWLKPLKKQGPFNQAA